MYDLKPQYFHAKHGTFKSSQNIQKTLTFITTNTSQ